MPSEPGNLRVASRASIVRNATDAGRPAACAHAWLLWRWPSSRTGDAPPALAIAAVTTVGYLGAFTGPPVIGVLAEATSLSTALLALIAVSAVLGLLAQPAFTNPRL